MNRQAVRARLESLADPGHKAFHAKLLPGVAEETLLGVRTPDLRRLAKEIARGDYARYLRDAAGDTHEEIMLQGMVIGCAKAPLEALLPHIAAHVKKISNWSLCDTFCAGLKLPKTYPEEMWRFITPYLRRKEEYPLRFGIVMLLFYYADEAHMDRVLSMLDAITHEAYYVRMAVAWALSMCYVAMPERVLAYLRGESGLDIWTFNKALQKIMESLQVTEAEKAVIRQMKRRE